MTRNRAEAGRVLWRSRLRVRCRAVPCGAVRCGAVRWTTFGGRRSRDLRAPQTAMTRSTEFSARPHIHESMPEASFAARAPSANGRFHSASSSRGSKGARPGDNPPGPFRDHCSGGPDHRVRCLPPHRDVRPEIRHKPPPLPVVYASPDGASQKLKLLIPTMLVTWDCTPVAAFTRFTSPATSK